MSARRVWQAPCVPVPSVIAAPSPDWRLVAVLVVLVALAMATSHVGNLGVGRDHATAAVRAVLQLAVVSVIITAALASLWWSMAVVVVMYLVATTTSARRIGLPARQVPWVGVAIAAGVLPVLALSLGSGVIPFTGSGIVPIAGIVIGGMMTASTLTGRRAFDELVGQFGAYEAALALGMTQQMAAFLVVQPSAREALTPGLDQTRTVGLVTLPGAFVGVLLGGGTPLQAAAAQVLVLVGLMAGQALTAAVLLRLIATAHVVRSDLHQRYPR
jgi:putative ABC transport system permease protein